MAEINFNVLESADAASFDIYNEGDDVSAGITLTISSPNTSDADKEIVISIGDDLDAFNGDGLTINFSDTGFEGNNSRFEDGVYTFTAVSGDDNGEISEGFAAIITRSVMLDSISYTINMSKAEKDFHNERIRLLNNLSYAASIGATEKFVENLRILERME